MKNKIQTQKGFTLMEIMITVGIIGIISAIAIPSYVEHVKKGKRADAKVELLRIAQIQESYFVQNLSYAQSLKIEAGGLGLGDPVHTEQDQYDITVASTPGGCDGTSTTPCTGFTLTATPIGAQVNDTYCSNFTFSNTGAKNISGPAAHMEQCWR